MLLIGNFLASGQEIAFPAPLPIDATVTARIIRPHSRMLELPLLVGPVFCFFLVVSVRGCETNFSGLFPPNPEGGIPDVLA